MAAKQHSTRNPSRVRASKTPDELGQLDVLDRGANQHCQDVRSADILPVTLSDLGIPRQRAAEMKKLAASTAFENGIAAGRNSRRDGVA